MMTVAKSRIVSALRDRGLHDRANWVDKELPERVDTEKNSGLLSMLSLDVAALADDTGDVPQSG